MRPINTSSVGPIRVEPNDLAIRAKVAGEALVAAMDCDADPDVARCARYVALNASAVSLAKLGRLLK